MRNETFEGQVLSQYIANVEALDSLSRHGGQERAILNQIERDLELQGLETEPQRVPWLQTFFSLPEDAPLAKTEAYQSGLVFGMDAASGFCVEALDVQPGDGSKLFSTKPISRRNA